MAKDLTPLIGKMVEVLYPVSSSANCLDIQTLAQRGTFKGVEFGHVVLTKGDYTLRVPMTSLISIEEAD